MPDFTTSLSASSQIIFIGGFNARATIHEYLRHLLARRPHFRGRVRLFSSRDQTGDVTRHVMAASGPVTLVGNSLGAATAAEIAVRCERRVHTLVTLAPVGSRHVNFRAIADSVSAWINLKTPVGIADLAALTLSQGSIGPWGYGPEPHVTRFIDSPLGHAEFWPQMDVVAAAGLEI